MADPIKFYLMPVPVSGRMVMIVIRVAVPKRFVPAPMMVVFRRTATVATRALLFRGHEDNPRGEKRTSSV